MFDRTLTALPVYNEVGHVAGVLDEALRSLPEKYRVALIFRYWHNMSYSEIARVTASSERAVKSNLNYGRRLLKEKLHGFV